MISDNNPCTHQQKCSELTAKAFNYSHIAANLSAMGSCSAFSFCRNSPLLAAKLALPTQKLQFVNIRQCVSFPLRKFRQIPALRFNLSLGSSALYLLTAVMDPANCCTAAGVVCN